MLDAEARGAPSCGLAPRVVATKLGQRQVGDELAQLGGGVSGERGLQPGLVLVHREITLRQRLAELVGGLLPLAIAGANRTCGWRGHERLPMLDLDSDKFQLDYAPSTSHCQDDVESDCDSEAPKVVSASREIAAPADKIFELIADPSLQPRWDGNDNLAEAPTGQRVRAVGDVFTMTITMGSLRENHVVEFEEGRLIAWRPSEPGQEPPGHLWRWELEPLDESRTLVTHTYDWSRLTDETRLPIARAITADKLQASIERLAEACRAQLTVSARPRTPAATRPEPGPATAARFRGPWRRRRR